MKNKILRLFLVALLIGFQTSLAIGQGNAPGRVMGEVFMNRSTDLGTGQVFFVHNSGSNEPGQGGADFPFASLDYAIGRCATAPAAASTGCTIFLMEGHAETLIAADAVDVDVAGIKVIGMGTGNLRATFTMATAAAAEINVDAANFYLANIIIVDNIACTACIELTANADGFHMNNVLIREGSQQPAIMIDMVGQADDVLIENSIFYVPTADTGNIGIDLSALTPARFTFRNNIVRGDFNTAALFGTGALTDAYIHDNVFENLLSGQLAVEFTAAALGVLENNSLYTDGIDTALDPGSLKALGNTWGSAINAQGGVPIPKFATFVPGYGYPVVKTGISLAATDDLFTVTGMVAITLMVGHITTVFSGATTDLQIVTDGGSAISADTVVDSYVDESLFYISADKSIDINGGQGSGVIEVVGPADSADIQPIIVGKPADTVIIRSEPGASDTGVYDMYIWYIPLTAGSTVVGA